MYIKIRRVLVKVGHRTIFRKSNHPVKQWSQWSRFLKVVGKLDNVFILRGLRKGV